MYIIDEELYILYIYINIYTICIYISVSPLRLDICRDTHLTFSNLTYTDSSHFNITEIQRVKIAGMPKLKSQHIILSRR